MIHLLTRKNFKSKMYIQKGKMLLTLCNRIFNHSDFILIHWHTIKYQETLKYTHELNVYLKKN